MRVGGLERRVMPSGEMWRKGNGWGKGTKVKYQEASLQSSSIANSFLKGKGKVTKAGKHLSQS